MVKVAVIGASLWAASVFAVGTTVDLTYSKYVGSAVANGVSQWLGLRYAAPPLGDLRFAAPQDPPYIDGVQPAQEHGKSCLATGDSPNTTSTSEDCLFLDVYAPTNATVDARLPVFFFIQGGGFNKDSKSNYNGAGIVAASGNNIIVVNFNYRVGPYGFLTDGASVTPNNGLLDQRKALEWVQNHIEQFGGNPGHVVLGGESAGAASISLHLAAYGGKDMGLFHAAAAESVAFAQIYTVEQSRYQYDNFAIRLGCAGNDSLACIRSKTAQELQAENNNIPFLSAAGPPIYMWGPVIDGSLITDLTYNAYEKGAFIKVPVIFGDDTNGGTVAAPKDTATSAESDVFLKNNFAYLTLDDLATIHTLYPKTNDTFPDSGAYWRQASNVYGEARYMCPALYISSAYTKYGVCKSYAYRWNVEDPLESGAGYGVRHTIEVTALFGPDNADGDAPASYWPNGTNAHAVPVIQAYWTSFIRSFDPNKYRLPGTATWEVWTNDKQERLLFGSGGTTAMESVDQGLRDRCAFWATTGPKIHQ